MGKLIILQEVRLVWEKNLPNYRIFRGENNKGGSGNHSGPFQLVYDWFTKDSGFGGLFRWGPSKCGCLANQMETGLVWSLGFG